MNEQEIHQKAINEFIAFANKMKDEGTEVKVVASALMMSCAVYSAYAVAGNDGALTDDGIEKMSKLFAERLTQVRALRELEANAKANPAEGAS